MSVLWHKSVVRPVAQQTRTLAILSIAAGVLPLARFLAWSISCSAAWTPLIAPSPPSHLNIILRDLVDEATAEDLADLPGVVDVDPGQPDHRAWAGRRRAVAIWQPGDAPRL
ncbi:MAG: hypothetical protein R3D55_23915 [Chloroflexota bacterium]